MLELAAHSSSREMLFGNLVDAGFCDEVDGQYVCAAALHDPYRHTPMIGWTELGDQVKTPAVLDGDGSIITPAVMYNRFFLNLRGWGLFKRNMIAGNEQFEADGTTLKWIFGRTNLIYQYPTLFAYATDPVGNTPRGLKNADGDCFYDLADLPNRRNNWQ